MEREPIVISVGGSLIVPDQIDTDFLSSFKALVTEEVEKGRRFVIIAGGGKTTRRYQDAAAAVSTLTRDDLDWIGIHATRLNAHLLRTLFRDIAYAVVMKNPHEDIETEKPVIIAAGWKPGSSTDYIATLFAKQLGVHKLANLSNIDHVYTADPKKDPEAKPIEEISWSDFRKLIPEEWSPGLSSPFDPVAAKEAEKMGLEVGIINGARLEELKKFLDGETFTGTLIS